MSCDFRTIQDLFREAGIKSTPGNKKELDQLIHQAVGVPYKKCRPDCWSEVKKHTADPRRRKALGAKLRKMASG